ncbi:aldo/keto reductase [Streptomyces sp. NPDC096311]|uniref:aldo/keto reductase n=1 Tax=Streptomyces sp. NPDC096311 TaxID=3366083 RepID=UPI00382B6AAF
MTAAFKLTPRHLGHGLLVHPLGINCGAIGMAGTAESSKGEYGPDDGRFLDGLRRAVELGVNLLDAADSYGAGRAERMIGRILRENPNEGLLISSKVGRIRGSAPHPYAGRHIRHQFQQTQDNLYIDDALDLYVLDSWDFGQKDRYLGTAIDQMHTLQQLGEIKAIGLRGPYTHYGATPAARAACAARFLQLFRLIRPNVIWTRLNALTPVIPLEGENLFDFTARHGVGVVLAAPLAHGLLTGESSGNANISLRGSRGSSRAFTPRALATVATGLKVLREHFGDAPGALTRLALGWCLEKADHCAAVVGFTNPAQVVENFTCLEQPLTAGEFTFVDEIYARIRNELEDTLEGQSARSASV